MPIGVGTLGAGAINTIMAFRAFVQSTQALDDTRQRVVCTVTDDVSVKVPATYEGSSLEQLKAACLQAILSAQRAPSLKALKVGDVLDLTPAPPTQADVDMAAFVAAYAFWRSAKEKVDNGFLPPDDPNVAAAFAAAVAAYKVNEAAYVGIG